jgi:hypothetical protein
VYRSKKPPRVLNYSATTVSCASFVYGDDDGGVDERSKSLSKFLTSLTDRASLNYEQKREAVRIIKLCICSSTIRAEKSRKFRPGRPQKIDLFEAKKTFTREVAENYVLSSTSLNH